MRKKRRSLNGSSGPMPLFQRLPDTAPYVPHSGTSREAAATMKKKLSERQRHAYEIIRDSGEFGRTDNELIDISISAGISPNGPRGRRVELASAGWVVKKKRCPNCGDVRGQAEMDKCGLCGAVQVYAIRNGGHVWIARKRDDA